MQISGRILWLAAAFAVSFLGCATYDWARSPETPAVAADATGPGEVRATKFVLVDDQGNVRAMLGDFQWAGPPGWKDMPTDLQKFTGLVIYGAESMPLVQLGADVSYSWLGLQTEAGFANYGASKLGAGMGLFSPPGTLRWGLGMQKEGNGGFVMNDLQGRNRFSAGMPTFGAVGMGIHDEFGEPLWKVPEPRE